jgi:hypothetical protein
MRRGTLDLGKKAVKASLPALSAGKEAFTELQ